MIVLLQEFQGNLDESAAAAHQRRPDVIMAVEIITLQGNKELSLTDSSRVNRKAREFLCFPAKHLSSGCLHYVFKL
jgi:hypothetical protein